MKLADYLAQENISPSQFAAKIGVPASTITRIVRFNRIPRPETISKIQVATGDRVRLADWYAETATDLARAG